MSEPHMAAARPPGDAAGEGAEPGAGARTPPVLSVHDLAVGTTATPHLPILRGISFELHAGEFLAVVGESGSGKSMTLRSILRLLPHALRLEAGSVRLAGHGDLLRSSESAMRKVRGSRLGFVPQQPWAALNPMMRIRRAAWQVAKAHTGWSRAETHERLAESLRRLEIVEPERVMGSFPSQLSGGMAQRAVLGLSFLLSPDVLLLDEPTTALDVTVQREVMDLLAAVCREDGRSVVLVTHDLGLAWNYCDSVVLLQRGSVVESGPVDVVLSTPEQPYARELVTSARLQSSFAGGGGHGAA